MATVICSTYGKEKKFKSRKDAINFFKECIIGSEGSEQSRYISVLMQLMNGDKYCSDKCGIIE